MAETAKPLFHWKAPRAEFAQRWILAVIGAVSVHGLCFYVFQIEEAQSPRSLPKTYGVTQLSANDPNARRVLRQIDDYYAAFEGTLLADTPLSLPFGYLDDDPYFNQIDVGLHPLPETPPAPDDPLESWFDPMVLPPLPALEPSDGTGENE